uniref:Uncharacterized protein n=1 Tax=Scophthalmus maximus TaxID=52904 RepID=A0A8D3BA85_SCOMX
EGQEDIQKACIDIKLRDIVYIPEYECGDTQDKAKNPGQQTAQFGILGPAHSTMRHWMYQCHIAIYAHQNKEIDTTVDIHLNAQVDDFAEEQTKGPIEIIGYIDSPKGQTGQQDKVSYSQVTQVDLSHGAGFLVETEYHQDKNIQHDSQYGDEQDIHRLTGDEPLPVVRIMTLCAIGLVLVSIQRCGAEVWDAVNIKHYKDN